MATALGFYPTALPALWRIHFVTSVQSCFAWPSIRRIISSRLAIIKLITHKKLKRSRRIRHVHHQSSRAGTQSSWPIDQAYNRHTPPHSAKKAAAAATTMSGRDTLESAAAAMGTTVLVGGAPVAVGAVGEPVPTPDDTGTVVGACVGHLVLVVVVFVSAP